MQPWRQFWNSNGHVLTVRPTVRTTPLSPRQSTDSKTCRQMCFRRFRSSSWESDLATQEPTHFQAPGFPKSGQRWQKSIDISGGGVRIIFLLILLEDTPLCLQYNDEIKLYMYSVCRSQWPHGLRRRSAAARLLRSWVRIPPGAWMFVCCECCVLSGRGLCDELITRPEESYWLWCVVMCDLGSSRMRRPWPALGRSATGKQNVLGLSQQYIYYSNGYKFRP